MPQRTSIDMTSISNRAAYDAALDFWFDLTNAQSRIAVPTAVKQIVNELDRVFVDEAIAKEVSRCALRDVMEINRLYQ